MKEGFRQSMAWLHTWAELVLGWVLFFMFLTGTAGYFDTEIARWMRPELPPVTQRVPAPQVLAVALTRLQEQAPQAERWFITLPGDRNNPWLRIFWQLPKQEEGASALNGNEQLDLAMGMPLDARTTGGGQLLYQMYWRLHYLPAWFTDWLIGICTMFMLVVIVTGIIVHKKIFVDFFTFRPGKGQRSWLDAHNVLSVMALPFHLMITYSGLIFFVTALMPLVISVYYGSGEENQRIYFDELQGRSVQAERSGTTAALTPLTELLAQADARWGEGRAQSMEINLPGDPID